jgi:hypothetical protein
MLCMLGKYKKPIIVLGSISLVILCIYAFFRPLKILLGLLLLGAGMAGQLLQSDVTPPPMRSMAGARLAYRRHHGY